MIPEIFNKYNDISLLFITFNKSKHCNIVPRYVKYLYLAFWFANLLFNIIFYYHDIVFYICYAFNNHTKLVPDYKMVT